MLSKCIASFPGLSHFCVHLVHAKYEHEEIFKFFLTCTRTACTNGKGLGTRLVNVHTSGVHPGHTEVHIEFVVPRYV